MASNDITTVEQLAPFEEAIAELAADGWDQTNGRFDWEDFLARAEKHLNIYLPGDMLDPVIRKVQRIARAAAAEANV